MTQAFPSCASFDQPQLWHWLEQASDEMLDELPFVVIGFDAAQTVVRYNRFEQQEAGLTKAVLGQQVFTQLAQCMNNYLVAQRFQDARRDQTPLDDTIPYILTWRMAPVSVRLRLLAHPMGERSYIAISPRAPIGR